MQIAYKVLLVYLAVMNLLAFSVFGVDKSKAKRGKWRVPERTLLVLAAFGGSAGAVLGMIIFRHKTRKRKFSVGVPLILAVQIGLAHFLMTSI